MALMLKYSGNPPPPTPTPTSWVSVQELLTADPGAGIQNSALIRKPAVLAA